MDAVFAPTPWKHVGTETVYARAMPRGRKTKKSGPLLRLRERLGISRQRVVDRGGFNTVEHVRKIEAGEVRMRWDLARKYAKGLGDPSISPDMVLSLAGETSPTVPVVGYVGAGAQIIPFNDRPAGEGMDRVDCPRGLNPETTEAVIVRGDSMLPIEDGWVLFYDREPEPADSLIGHLCVVRLAGDGVCLVKQLRRGHAAAHFTLWSTNASPMEDVRLEWAARVRAYVDPRLAGRVRDAC